MKLHFDDIKVKRNTIVHNGHFLLEDKGIYLLHGDNGTGKSLIFKNIKFNYRDEITLVSQNSNGLIDELSVLENINLTNCITLEKKTLRMLRENNLEYLLDLNIKELSGGEKRIICLFRGILSEAKCILFDEPTNDLDFAMVKVFNNILNETSNNKYYIIITHDDRLNKFARGTFIIKDKNVNYETKEQIIVSELNKVDSLNVNYDKNKLQYHSNHIISKIWNKNYVSILSAIVLCVYTIFIICEIKKDDMEIIEYNEKGQINLFYLSSTLGSSLLNEGAYPIGILENLQSEDISIGLVNSNLKEEKSISNSNQKLYLKSTNDYRVYPLEYHLRDEKAYVYTMETYLSEILGMDVFDGWVDTHEYFSIQGNEEFGERQEFDELLFNKSIDIIENTKSEKGNIYELVFMTVKLREGFSIHDFITEKEVQKLLNDNGLYIQSNETILVANQIEVINKYRIITNKMVVFSLLVLFIDLFSSFLNIRLKDNSIIALNHYGFTRYEVERNILRYNSDLIIRIVLGISLIFYTLITFEGDELLLVGTYMPTILSILTLYLAFYFNKIINIRMLRRFFSWRYR